MNPIEITFFTTLRKENEMTQNELILKTAQVSGVARKDVEHVLKVAGDVIGAALIEEGVAVLPELGKLSTSVRKARMGTNPKTGEKIAIAERKAVNFKPGKALLQAVNA
jgi:nucleoid DNA-binding protein